MYQWYAGALKIVPGDVIAADVNGILAFPQKALLDVIRIIRGLQDKEDRCRQAINGGQSLESAYLF